jgi:hypothetical protein
MLDSPDRFAYSTQRLHAFDSTGNAYDACQTDERITTGDTLIILNEGVIGIAYTWPIAVTAARGALHALDTPTDATLEEIAGTFSLAASDLAFAAKLAATLGLELDPLIANTTRKEAP